MIHSVKWKRVGIILMLLVMVSGLCWLFYTWGINHAMYDSFISERNGYYILYVDGQEATHAVDWAEDHTTIGAQP